MKIISNFYSILFFLTNCRPSMLAMFNSYIKPTNAQVSEEIHTVINLNNNDAGKIRLHSYRGIY